MVEVLPVLRNISNVLFSVLAIKNPLQPGHVPFYTRDFSLLYQGENLFPDLQGSFTLYNVTHSTDSTDIQGNVFNF